MKRKIAIALLSLGTIAGFACGFHSLRRGIACHRERQDTFERHVATICTDAALRAKQDTNRD